MACNQYRIFDTRYNRTYKIVWAERMEDIIDKYFT